MDFFSPSPCLLRAREKLFFHNHRSDQNCILEEEGGASVIGRYFQEIARKLSKATNSVSS